MTSMLISALGALLWFTPPSAFSQSDRVTYRVSTTGKDKTRLISVYVAVIAHQAPGLRQSSAFHITQRLSGKRFLGYSEGRPNTLVCLHLDAATGEVDGEWIHGITCQTTDETFEYTTVLGAQRTVRIVRPIDEPAAHVAMTKDDFVKRLKRGETFYLPDYEKVSCGKCVGDGKLSALAGNGYPECPDCAGKGHAIKGLLVKW